MCWILLQWLKFSCSTVTEKHFVYFQIPKKWNENNKWKYKTRNPQEYPKNIPNKDNTMELAHSLLLNEEALSKIPENKKNVFVFEWLRFLDKVLAAAQKVSSISDW